MAQISHRECKACKQQYEIFVDRGEELRMTHEDVEGIDCPSCGGVEYRRLLSAGPGKHRNRASEEVLYPYYNHGLGMWLESKEHKDRVLKERGLREAPGLDMTQQALEDGLVLKEREREYQDYVEEMENHPDHADWRRTRDLAQLNR